MSNDLQALGDFSAALKPHIRGELRTDRMTRALYATDASMYRIEPLGVLIPEHVDDVQAALETAGQYGIPVLPRGGGSSLAGQTVGAALVIDFSNHLNGILEINREEQWARVQPGLVLDTLTAALEPSGLMVGPDPASSNRATLGGMVANNSTGTHSILYGNVINHIRSVKALLADGSQAEFACLQERAWDERGRRSGLEGEIYQGLTRLLEEQGDVVERDTSKHWRRNSGYRLEYLLREERNLAQLLCGSEGTLAVITELTIGLVPRPERTALAVAQFHTRREALRAVVSILETDPSAVELFDDNAIRQTRLAPGYAHRLTFLEGDPGAILVVEYYGESDTELADRVEVLRRRLAREGHGYAVVPALTAQQMSNVWTIRKEGLGLIMSVKGDAKPQAFIEDAAVPVEHLADYIDELEEVTERLETPMVLYAHASAGCLHARPFLNTREVRDVQRMRDIAVASMELVRKYGGVVSSEHGEGLARSWLNEQLFGPELYDTYRRVKRIFDPKNILNPGKIVDAPPMTENLRMGPGYETLPTLDVLDFSDDGGYAGAVELCNGNGACRKLESGTMCPSYMVTLDEKDTTRARANILRSALSGQIPHSELTGKDVAEVMDLCIMCKACKTECPSNVDMAKIKAEWLSKYWKAKGLPLRTRFFAYMPFVTRKLANSPVARAANWFNGLAPTRKMMERTLGLSTKRALPSIAPESFTAWFNKQLRKQRWRT
ncbi:MAG TPA: FAD-linked oxidase C-terminal domain-containing protein, partial [Rhodothermales bacterium]|nr:FAD-linked oxidase C-terminal domain-containing protein [Rhodothermales bacterium]